MAEWKGWQWWAEEQAGRVRAAGQWRAVRDFDAAGPTGTLPAGGGRRLTSFASNDYLGLTQHPALKAAAAGALDRWGTGSGAARLVAGSRPVHSELEHALAAWKRADQALVFSTGYTANLGVLSTFGGTDTLILSDELNHASIVDGCRLARGRVEVYRHGDACHVDELLRRHRGPAVVVTDTVFSMDGDEAPVTELAELCALWGALLVVDEAHAVLGPEPDLSGVDHLRVGTLSKTLGALGGFVAGRRRFIELLVNRARPFLFTTALAPADAAAALAGLAILRAEEGEALRRRLRCHVDHLAPGHASPIVPLVLGDESRAVAASEALLGEGFLVPAIRPPTVAPGSSRLRITLSAAHSDGEVSALGTALEKLQLR